MGEYAREARIQGESTQSALSPRPMASLAASLLAQICELIGFVCVCVCVGLRVCVCEEHVHNPHAT